MKKIMLGLSLLFLSVSLVSKTYEYSDSWENAGIQIIAINSEKIELNYSIDKFSLSDLTLDGKNFKKVNLPGVFLPNNEGAPDLPGLGRYLAIPQNAEVMLEIIDSRIERFQNVELAPAPRIPLDTEDGPLEYKRDEKIYARNAFYPNEPIKLSKKTKLRGVDVVTLGITPFQYNPVTKELLVYRVLKLSVSFKGGNGYFGDDRLRNRWWDPILEDAVLNFSSLPQINYDQTMNSRDGAEYLIICPDDPTFIAWADSIKTFRQEQGISTMMVTTTEVGGNSVTAIENYIDNAYYNWSTPPAAVLLLGDYGSTSTTITTHLYTHPDSYPDYASDNRYADVDGDDLPDIVLARMTANNEAQLEVMITKFLDYERNPPTDSDFYDHPITALGWQTERWFQICSEAVGGFFLNEQGKNPVRINEIYSGTPGSTWSTATNTQTVVDYFGPSGQGYIPATPSELGGWSGGSAADVVNAINDGSFLLQHRDHGSYSGWGEPGFQSSNINSLTNTGNKLPFIFSINCQTGAFHNSSECFAEKFHRHTYGGENSGALGLTAATEVSYSFVNDTFVWGLYDNMWPEYLPDYGTTPASRGVLPAFGNAAGKHFLYQSSWPYNTDSKQVTYRLFHHHGDAFTTLYSEVPQALTVYHNSTLLSGAASFSVSADNGSLIALSVDGEIIGTAEGTGSNISISITPQDPGSEILITVTKQNYYRYTSTVEVIPPSGPYVSFDSFSINDLSGNNNNEADFGEEILLDITLENAGSEPAYNVSALLTSTDSMVTINDDYQAFGTITNGATSTQTNAFTVLISDIVPDQHSVSFELEISDGSRETWTSGFSLVVNAPALEAGSLTIDDFSGGNGDGRLDPGEAVNVIIENFNSGHSDSPDATGNLSSSNGYVTINNSTYDLGVIGSGSSINASFSVSISAGAPVGTAADFHYQSIAGGYGNTADYTEIIGQIPVCVIDLDPNFGSGSELETALNSLGVTNEYFTSIPADLSLYNTIFLCLGIYSNNHVLTSTEGQTFADYLNSGGNLYMEGGDTWVYDSQTAVHSMFNIDGTTDGTGDLSTVSGIATTFTNGMNYSYGGGNSYIDHLSAISPAETIFENTSVGYFCGVSYDEGSYKTIGTSFEFGGLADSSSPSTKENLMNEYLNFFGVGSNPSAPSFSVSPTSLDFGDVFLGEDETLNITITNNGGTALTGNITTPNDFSVATTRNNENVISYSVSAGGSEVFAITFTPTSATSYNDNITITSNDPSNPTNYVGVSGSGINPSEIDIDPAFFNVTLATDETTDEILTINNLGNADLNFEVNIAYYSRFRSTVNIYPQSSGYNTGSCTSSSKTESNLITGHDTEDGWAKFDVSSIPDGSTINSIEFYGYVYNTYYPYWSITPVSLDPVSAGGVELYSDINAEATSGYYLYQNESSSYAEGWHNYTLGGTANSDLASALTQDWFAIGIVSRDNSTTYYIDLYGWENDTYEPYLVVDYTENIVYDWLSVEGSSTYNGSIPGGDQLGLEIEFDAAGLVDSVYTADLIISSNDPQNPTTNVTATLNVDSNANPFIIVDPENIEITLNPGMSSNQYFTISNTGHADLTYSSLVNYGIRELEDISFSTEHHYNINKRTDCNYVVTNTNIESRDPGDILIDLDVETPTGDNQILGCEFDGDYIWLTGGYSAGDNQIYKLNTAGTLINTYQQGTTSEWGMRDLAFDGAYLYAGDENGFYRIDPANGSVITLFSGNLGLGCIRAVAYDEDNDYFYAANWDTNIIAFDINGNQLNSLTAPGLTGMYGLAYADNSLWIYDRSGVPESTFYQYDIASQSLTGTSYQIPLLTGATEQMNGGAFYSDEIVPGKICLGGIAQGTPLDRFFAMELSAVSDWLSITQNQAGTVDSLGGTKQVTLHFDTAELSLGTHTATIEVSSNDPQQPQKDIAITFNVSGQLAPPQNIVISISDNDVILSWPIVPGVSIYRIYRSQEYNDNFNFIGSSGSNSYTDYNAALENLYYYYITSE